MGKRKRKLTAAEKARKKERRQEYMTIFVRGKQKQVKRPPTIDGMVVDEFIRTNADPILLHQNEMWEFMLPEPALEECRDLDCQPTSPGDATPDDSQLVTPEGKASSL